MEVLITKGDIDTIEWLQDMLYDMNKIKGTFSEETREKMYRAQGFLHRIKTNALTAEKLSHK